MFEQSVALLPSSDVHAAVTNFAKESIFALTIKANISSATSTSTTFAVFTPNINCCSQFLSDTKLVKLPHKQHKTWLQQPLSYGIACSFTKSSSLFILSRLNIRAAIDRKITKTNGFGQCFNWSLRDWYICFSPHVRELLIKRGEGFQRSRTSSVDEIQPLLLLRTIHRLQ